MRDEWIRSRLIRSPSWKGECHGNNHVSEQHCCCWAHTSDDDGWILLDVPVPDFFKIIITTLINVPERSE
jgi:hypothetical protein